NPRRHRIRKAGARREVIEVRMNQRAIEHVARVPGGEDLPGRRIDVRQQIVAILHRREVLVPEPEIDREIRSEAPRILPIHLPSVAEEVGFVVQRQPLLRDEAQKKITEPGVRVPSVVEAQESVQRAQIDVVDDVAAPFDAELVVVRAFRPRDIPGELEDLRRLVLRAEEGAPYPREPGNLRVRQTAAVDRVLGYALDTVLR